MQKVAQGIFLLPQNVINEIPCHPRDLNLEKISGALGNTMQEQVIISLLVFSVEQDEWCGVKWQSLIQFRRTRLGDFLYQNLGRPLKN